MLEPHREDEHGRGRGLGSTWKAQHASGRVVDETGGPDHRLDGVDRLAAPDRQRAAAAPVDHVGERDGIGCAGKIVGVTGEDQGDAPPGVVGDEPEQLLGVVDGELAAHNEVAIGAGQRHEPTRRLERQAAGGRTQCGGAERAGAERLMCSFMTELSGPGWRPFEIDVCTR